MNNSENHIILPPIECYVVARFGYSLILTNAEQPDKSGYYTDKMTAKDILNQDSFRIVIINEAARPIASSNTPISSEDLKNYLTKSSSGR